MEGGNNHGRENGYIRFSSVDDTKTNQMRHDSDKEMISNHLSLMNARPEQL